MSRLIRIASRPLAFVGAGAIGALGQAPFGLWPFALLAFAVAVTMWQQSASARHAAFRGWAFGLGYFLVSLSWIVNPFLVDPLRTAWMIPFALLSMCGGLSLLWGAAFFASKRLGIGPMGLVALWGLAELLRGYLFTGFPWALPAYIWLDTSIAHLAAWIGPYGLTVVTLFAAAQISRAVLSRSLVAGFSAIVTFALLFGVGIWAMVRPMPVDLTVSVRVVQPNASQALKWDPRYIPIFFERALEMSDPEGADLVIWPETAVAPILDAAGDDLRAIHERISPAQAVVGLRRVDGYRGYNSAVLLSPQGEVAQVYDKHHLVPFGEYIPFPRVLTALGFRTFTADGGYGFSAGDGPALMDFGALGKALPLICYEAIFPRDLRGTARPDWLLHITNDAWFGTFSGPQQSLAQSRFRAIETGLPMVRAANTGISAVIDARGTVRQSIALGQAGAFTAPLPAPAQPTFYVRTKEMPSLLLIAILLLLTAKGEWRRRYRETD
ncbi:apolipoprotein N-acyltransferase [Celeribacter marinus]|uniref:apolipoprotein N-acyltransferase n=1 Tax=Celeribacter marinus TaxID=1397108 RepID=UPI003F6C3458